MPPRFTTLKRTAVGHLCAAVLLSFAPALAAQPDVSFRNDIMPILSKAGCASGACHAKPEGQSNYKLSVFGYDPDSDYRETVTDVRGRRIFFAAPDQSLLLLKATGEMPHEGGARIAKDSAEYRMLLEWIMQGATNDAQSAPRVQAIRVEPERPRITPGAKTTLRVTAEYSDGSRRDVTRKALYTSQEPDFATVSEEGEISAGGVRGEGVVVVNYLGNVQVVKPVVPPEKTLGDADFAGYPVYNEIDRRVYARLRAMGIRPSGLCSDAEFARRSALDAVGRLPAVGEIRDFMADTSAEKRARWVDRLLADSNYANHWAVKWGDWIRPNPSRVGVKPVYLLDAWLRDVFRRNVPYDRMVRELLTAQGSTHQSGPVALFRDKRDPVDAASLVSQIFLGVRMECAKCHHHPSEKWSQEDHYRLAAFFGKMRSRGQGISAPISGEVEMWWYDPGGKGVTHPVTDAPLTPKAPDGPEIPYTDGVDPRAQLVDWMVSEANPFFSKAIVNRIWGELLGRGLVEPVDDFRVSNPPSNPELLDWLAEDFRAHGFDLKHLIRNILLSAAYQRSAEPNDSNLADQKNYSRALRRRLSAEVLLDAVGDLTGVRDGLGGLPPGSRAVQTWNHKIGSEFMDAFGRPNSSLECPCERERKPTIVQSLHLMNSPALQSKLASPAGRTTAWANSSAPVEDTVREIYLAAYGRPPDAEELRSALAHVSRTDVPRLESMQDLVWTLINTAEFVFNH